MEKFIFKIQWFFSKTRYFIDIETSPNKAYIISYKKINGVIYIIETHSTPVR